MQTKHVDQFYSSATGVSTNNGGVALVAVHRQ